MKLNNNVIPFKAILLIYLLSRIPTWRPCELLRSKCMV